MDRAASQGDCGGLGRARNEVRPEVEANGGDVFRTLLGEDCRVDLVPRLSE